MNNRPIFHDPSRVWISVIGMGAGGALLFNYLVTQAKTFETFGKSIGFILIDSRKKEEFGRGIAWGSNQSDLFLANMRIHTMGFDQDLMEKIKAEMKIEDPWSPENDPDRRQFVARKIIGNCLHSSFLEKLELCKSLDIPVVIIEEQVSDISRYQKGYSVEVNNGNNKHFCDFVVLALGNVPKLILNEHKDDDRFIQNPWDWGSYPKDLAGKSVMILGTGPSAVDAIVHCADLGAQKIIAVSRTGKPQFPRPKNQYYFPAIFNRESLDRELDRLQSVGIPFNDTMLTDFLSREFQTAAKVLNAPTICADYNSARRVSNLGARKLLTRGIEEATEASAWYTVLKSLDELTPYTWNSLTPEGKSHYKKRLESEHNRLSFGMALRQAQKLVELIDDGRLEYDAMTIETHQDNSNQIIFDKNEIIVKTDTNTYLANCLINCMGIGSSILDFNSKLVDSLSKKGVISPLKDFGGFEVEFDTGQIISHLNGAPHKVSNFYSLTGSFTRGVHLLTNCIFQLGQSSVRTGNDIFDKVIKSTPSIDF